MDRGSRAHGESGARRRRRAKGGGDGPHTGRTGRITSSTHNDAIISRNAPKETKGLRLKIPRPHRATSTTNTH